MKKSILLSATLFIILLFWNSMAKAQLPISYGVKGGLNIATLNDVRNVDSKRGLIAGAFVNVSIPNRPLSLQPELLYTQKGVKASGSGLSSSIELTYIEVPLLFKFSFPKTGQLRTGVFIGPYLGFNINAEGTITGNGNSSGGSIDESIRNTDFGFVIGGGLGVKIFQLELRYGAGLTKVFEDNSSGKNGVISLVTGIRI